VRAADRVVEVRRRDVELERPSPDLREPLQLVEPNVDTRFVQPREGALDALVLDQPLDVSALDAGVLQERPVRTRAVGEDGAVERRQQVLGPAAELVGDPRAAVVERRRRGEVAAKTADELREVPRVLQQLR
jgi:hypothetical protein